MAKKSKKVSTTKSEPKEALRAESSVLESNPDAVVIPVDVLESKPTRHSNTPVVVRALIPFYDLEAKIERGAGAEWEVSEDRAELLKKLGIAIVL